MHAVSVGVALLALQIASVAAEPLPEELLRGLAYRSIGPFRGGRANAVSGVRGDPRVYYFGAAGGGVWKTTNGGVHWRPIFDGTGVAAIGAIAVAESDPNVVYVGTGDANLRTNSLSGSGVFRSNDAGESWTFLGLAETRNIGKIVVHPTDPDVVYVAALGRAYGPSAERGLYRSLDGGKSWEKTLYVDPDTGAVDVTIDVSNPKILFATTWQVRRTPFGLTSGGEGSGIWKSVDSGATWNRIIGNGLPAGILGRIGVAISPADSRRVYAVIEAEARGLYRSDDSGESFRLVNRSRALTSRAWYFSKVVADPQNVDRLYVLNIPLLRSVDGGESFEVIPQYHVDNMSLWIDPDDPGRILSGNDGGANISVDFAKSWTRSDENQPTGQIYRVATDEGVPYFVYGGQQDFDTLAIRSRSAGAGIGKRDWYPVGGCEMGWVAPDPANPDVTYSSCTDGGISRYDHRTQRLQSVEPWPETYIGYGAADARYRFQWTAPILFSRHDTSLLYMAGNVLFRTRNGGMSWDVVSPDLTRNDPETQVASGGPLTRDNVGTEFYGTIYALDESPAAPGVFWAGTDDGLVHVTRDSGASWTDVTPEEIPPFSRVHAIDASPHDAGSAYVAVDRHENDDDRPYVFGTTDYGKTWRRLVEGLPSDQPVKVVREDPVRRGLLYAGTSLGVFVSFDGGEMWQSLQRNLPPVAVYDLTVADDDLVLATHGRAFWILDDVRPLRQISVGTTSKRLHLFEPGPALRIRESFASRSAFEGENHPKGAIFYFSLAQDPREDVTLSIFDADVRLVREFSKVAARKGLNRFVWDLRHEGPETLPGQVLFWHPPLEPPVGPLALSGSYRVEVRMGGELQSASLRIVADPRVPEFPGEPEAQLTLHTRIRDRLSDTTRAVETLRELREKLRTFEGDSAERAFREISEIESALTEPGMEAPSDIFHFGARLDGKLAALMGMVSASDRAPTSQSYLAFEDLDRRVQERLDRLERLERWIENDFPGRE